MKKLLLLFLMLISCNIPKGFDPCEILYKANGNLMNIVIQVNTYNGKEVFLNWDNWIGEFNYKFELENSQEVYISVTNLNGGIIIGAIYKDGYLLSYGTDPVFVEISKFIE